MKSIPSIFIDDCSDGNRHQVRRGGDRLLWQHRLAFAFLGFLFSPLYCDRDKRRELLNSWARNGRRPRPATSLLTHSGRIELRGLVLPQCFLFRPQAYEPSASIKELHNHLEESSAVTADIGETVDNTEMPEVIEQSRDPNPSNFVETPNTRTPVEHIVRAGRHIDGPRTAAYSH